MVGPLPWRLLSEVAAGDGVPGKACSGPFVCVTGRALCSVSGLAGTWSEPWLLLKLLPNVLASIGSDDRAAIPPSPNAAISCGRSGRDFLLVF